VQAIGLDELEAAVGLSYENFKRNIIIPRALQEFLQLAPGRTQMMKEPFICSASSCLDPPPPCCPHSGRTPERRGAVAAARAGHPEVLKEQESN